MSKTPHPENLISGYLDNQLTPTERAEVERMLESEPELKVLHDQLQRQSRAVADLPQFRLGDDFANRLMASSQFEEAFGGPSDKLQPGVNAVAVRSNRFVLSAAAIAALAAMVLVALFLPTPVDVAVLDSQLDDAVEEFEEEGMPGSTIVAGQEGGSDEFEPPSQMEVWQPKTTTSDNSIFNAEVADSTSDKAVMGRSVINSKSEGSLNAKRGVASKSRFANPVAPVQTMQQRVVETDADDWNAGNEIPDREVASNGVAVADAVRKSLGMAAGRAESIDDPQQQVLMAQVPDGIDSVVEVEFQSSGQALVDELQLALSRNFIAAEDLVDGNKLMESDSVAGAMAKGGGGFGGGGGANLGQTVSQNDSETMAVLVNTTPRQMSVLVEDLKSQKNAKVGTYELPKLLSANFMAPNMARSRVGRLESEKPQSQFFEPGESQKEKKFKARHQAELEDLERRQRYRGFAQSLRKNSSTDFGERLERSSDQTRNQAAGLSLTEEQKNMFRRKPSEPVVNDAESMARYYLLLVRGGGAKEAANEASPAAPSASGRRQAPEPQK